jgi:hypothetical protein
MGVQANDIGIGFQIGYDNSNKIKAEYNTNLQVQTPVHFFSESELDFSDWQHVVCVYEKTNNLLKIYLNGLFESEHTQTWFNNSTSNSNPLFIGKLRYSDYFFNGEIDDIGIWNRVLTEEEIQNLYNANICYDHVTVTDTLIINFNMTGFNPVTYEHSIEIYPNPTSDHITINYGDFIGLNGYTLSIFNPMGQLVHTSNITQQQEYLDLNSWGGVGVYNVVIYNPQGGIVSTKQIVLQ